jgi:hypothetical protein
MGVSRCVLAVAVGSSLFLAGRQTLAVCSDCLAGQSSHSSCHCAACSGRAGKCQSCCLVHHPFGEGPAYIPRCVGPRGTLYARPYNYRNLLDYPWHAPLRRCAGASIVPRSPVMLPESVPVQPMFEPLIPTPSSATGRAMRHVTSPYWPRYYRSASADLP